MKMINNFINKKVKFAEIKKIFYKKGFILIKKKSNTYSKDSQINVLFRTALSSLIVICIFSVSPIIVEFSKERVLFSKDFENNSKDNFKKALENKNSELDTGVNETYLVSIKLLHQINKLMISNLSTTRALVGEMQKIIYLNLLKNF